MTIKTAIQFAATIVLLTLLQGCVIAIGNDGLDEAEVDWREQQTHNLDYINHLSLNASRIDVVSDLGDPDFKESFRQDDEVVEILYYRTNRVKKDGQTSKSETTPLVFVDTKLVGWGQAALEKASQ